ncbi:MAG: hypothetical protein IPK03_16975 [Bacteroidetes bacterium]|nr:hypothetical protein [Bacteroidota bacterium]
MYRLGYKQSKNAISYLINNIRGRAIAFDKVNNAIYCSGNKGFYKITPSSIDTIKINDEAFYASKILTFSGQLYALSTKGNFYQIQENKNFTLLNSKFGIPN